MARQHFSLILFPMLASVLAACGPQRVHFRPAELTRAAAAPGHAAATYRVRHEEESIGDVKVWSPGAYEVRTNGSMQAVHISMRVRNDSQHSIRFDPRGTDLEIFSDRDQMFVINEPTRVFGRLVIPPETTERLEIYFRLPRGVRPGRLQGFEFNWRVRVEDAVYSRSTPFTRERRRPPPSYTYWRPAFYYYNWTYPWYPSPWPFWY